MRSKSEAPEVVIQHVNLQASLGNVLKRYHSDNAKELKHKDVLNMLKAKDTRMTTTMPTRPSRTA